jgi:hypothetical protein
MSTIRLVGKNNPTVGLAVAKNNPGRLHPTVRLAHCPSAQGSITLHTLDVEVPLLVSFTYLVDFLRFRLLWRIRDWALDSGAFSAHANGKPIDLAAYVEAARELRATDPKLVEVFALDVIGDWRASANNCERMHELGIPAIPTFHLGSPEHELTRLARTYPKIALGGCATRTRWAIRLPWARQCFARIWPARVHGFGFGDPRSIMALPWHSVDATSWEVGPCAFGQWRSFGVRRLRALSVRGGKQDLRGEIQWYLKLERRARRRWRREMSLLETL